MSEPHDALSSWNEWTATRGESSRALVPVEHRDSLENPSVDLVKALQGLFDYQVTAAGPYVTAESALRQSVVFACIRVLSETVGWLPLHVYRRTKGGGKEVAREHPLYPVLHSSPNESMTSFDYRETATAHACIWGSHFSIITRRPSGEAALIALLPRMVKRKYTAVGRLQYLVTFAGGVVDTYDAEDILDIRGLSLDGVNSIAPVLNVLREAIGLAMATEEHGSRFFSNGARPGGILTTDGTLDDQARARVRASWNQMQGGLTNAYKTAILEGGLKYEAVAMQADHAQLAETRRMQVEEICRPFRMPPSFVQDHTRATFSNVEQQDLHFAKHTITPWVTRFEQELNRKLFRNDPDYFCEFNLDGLMRGDFRTRMDGFARGIQSSIFTPNEVRAMLNLPPVDGGDKLYIQQNMATFDQLGQGDDEPAPPSEGKEPKPAKRELPSTLTVQAVVNIPADAIRVEIDQKPANVTVHTPEMRVEPRINVAAPQVSVQLPSARSVTTFEHDEHGNIVKTVTSDG